MEVYRYLLRRHPRWLEQGEHIFATAAGERDAKHPFYNIYSDPNT